MKAGSTGSAGFKTSINLLRGHPNRDLLPAPQMRRASDHALSDADIFTHGLAYGPDLGYEPLRTHIATWLSDFYQPQHPVGLARICITGGASEALARILQVFSDPIFTKVWMVSPTYFLACAIFQDSGLRNLRAVPQDEEGINIEFLREELRASDQAAEAEGNSKPTLKLSRPWTKIYRHLIYAIPTFSNPSSKTMTRQRREQLIRVAREYDALIINDDVYDFLQWRATKTPTQSVLKHAVLPRIVDIDRYFEGGSERDGADGFGNSVSNGSFTKIASPGCRTGWIEGTAKFAYGLSQGGSTKSGGAPSQLTASIMTSLITSGDLESHICGTLLPAYEQRYRTMISAIEKYLIPLGVALPQPISDVVGGYFIWLSLPSPLHADQVATRAKEDENLIIAPGSLFAVHGDSEGQDLEGKVRLCFSCEDEHLLGEGISRLSKVVHRLQQA